MLFSPVSYKRAISTLGCAKLELFEAIDFAARHGLDALELRALAGSIDLPVHLAASFNTPAALADYLRACPVRIAAIDTSFRLTGSTNADRARLLDHVPWAEALGVPWLRVFDGEQAESARPKEAVETLHWWRQERAAHGWQTNIMIETHDSLFDAARIGRLLAAAPPDSAILWDSHHTWKRGGEDPLYTWRTIRPHIVHVHVKDSAGKPGAATNYDYVPPGQGEFPMARLADVLRGEFHGVVSLEWERFWHPSLAPLEVALGSASEAAWW